MKISFLNESIPNYGADETMKYYYNYAIKKGYDAKWNEYNYDIDFYIVGMVFDELKLRDFLKPSKFIYIEHSIEMILPWRKWIRSFIVPNACKIYFMSPRHREHIMSVMGGKTGEILEKNNDLLVVPIDYELFKRVPNVEKIKNMYLFVGLIHPNKGITELLQLAQEDKSIIISFVGKEDKNFDVKLFDKYKNVHYFGHVAKESLPEIYNISQYICLLPQGGSVESAGRTIFEGILCGCKPIINNDVGNASWGWYQEPKEIIKNMNFSTEKLFDEIEKAVK